MTAVDSREVLEKLHALIDALDPEVRAGRIQISGAQLTLTCPACQRPNLSLGLRSRVARCGCGHEVRLTAPQPYRRFRRVDREMRRNRAPDVAWFERYVRRVGSHR